ncbi:MAG TPA: HWE histidine kinase domain-containing protein [Sphingomicrobium sp.]|nr:HWE histidine kinase domain-containing protein [Sphingomicrobium sp.]
MSDKAHKDKEQKAAEADVAQFKHDLGPFVVAAETTRMPMVFTDAKKADNPIIFVNDAFLKLTGYDRDEVLAQSFNFLLAPGADSHDLDEIKEAFAGKEGDPEIRFRHKDGSPFYATIFVNPVRDEAGKIVQHFVSLVDTTMHHEAQKHAAMLIDELNHRVKNTLATVQSIVTQAVRNSSDPEIVRESIETRIAALSRSHDLLGREKWQGAGLRDLVVQSLDPFSVAEGRAERFTIEGENIRLSPKAALALGIAFNELATNAVKYGAFSNEAGTISIEWTLEPEPDGRWLCLHWREKNGPPVTAPTRKGFGSRVLERGLAHELNGKVDLNYAPAGVICTIHVPAPQSVRDG